MRSAGSRCPAPGIPGTAGPCDARAEAERSRAMGDKGGKKGKSKDQKQKATKHDQEAQRKKVKQQKPTT
jgi:hypothetical protein